MKQMLPCAPDTMHRDTGTAVVIHCLGAGALALMAALGWTTCCSW